MVSRASFGYTRSMDAGADLALVAGLIANRPRAAMLDLLLGGGAHPAGDLARQAGVAPSTASGHLASLEEGGLVTVEHVGRQRRYRLAGAHVAGVLESLASIAPALSNTSLNQVTLAEQLREARTCYDHLAGKLGVAVTEALVRRRALEENDGVFELTQRGSRLLEALGVDVGEASSRRRSFAPGCLDWTERRQHLAGSLGAAVTDRLLDLGWIVRRPGNRSVSVSRAGATQLRTRLGVETA
jgi:DNA-binding transcriptional ArsR family regulator